MSDKVVLMTDDWSLEGVEIPAWDGVVHVYTQTSIEILREKLIEDIKTYKKIDDGYAMEELIQIINKRFGVEE